MQEVINKKDTILETVGELNVLVNFCVCVCGGERGVFMVAAWGERHLGAALRVPSEGNS